MATSTQSFYEYDPSTPAAVAVTILFGLGFLFTMGQLIWKRSWIWLVMALAIAAEIIGYVARVDSTLNLTENTPYVLQFTLIILAPVVMAGVIYVAFARLIFWVVPPEERSLKLLWVSPRFVTLIFVGFDVASLVLQVIAALQLTSTKSSTSDPQSSLDTGKNLGIAGVSLQMAAFGFFSLITVRFHFISKKISPAFADKNQYNNKLTKSWKPLLTVINVSCVLILIRSIFREIEFVEGKDGVVQQSEWYLYVFDTLPILGVVLIYCIWFPGRFIGNLGFRVPKDYKALEDTDNKSVEMTAV